MMYQSRPLEARPRNWRDVDTRASPVKGRNRNTVPAYEKPLVKTGEASLWRNLNSGDRVEVIPEGKANTGGTVDARTCDGSTVWIILDHGMGRIAVTEGDHIALVPQLATANGTVDRAILPAGPWCYPSGQALIRGLSAEQPQKL
jgi:hypothetical protein